MKKISLVLLLIFAVSVLANAQSPLNIMTFNIRWNNKGDSLDAWPYRKDNAALQIRFYQADIVGVQEALQDQMEDLAARLPNYDHVGVGRSDGKTGGEYSAIFYNKERLEVLESSTFWLSQTPAVAGSKGWDADFPRIVTWAKFRDKITGRQFYDFNTHFDHIGKVARRESAHLLLKAVDSIAGKMPAIITGDFNATASDEPIQVITNPSDPKHLTDTKGISQLPHYGPEGTFNAFGPMETGTQPIDHIFVKGNFSVLRHAAISESWKGHFSSDHFPVFCSLVVPK